MRTNKLLSKLDETMDYDEYAALERRNPRLAGDLVELIAAGVSPRQIATHIADIRPHRWPEAQAILAAARYLESQVE